MLPWGTPDNTGKGLKIALQILRMIIETSRVRIPVFYQI